MKKEYINQFEAATHTKMSPKLLEWFTKNSPKHNESRKLQYTLEDEDGVFYYDKKHLEDYNNYLSTSWPIPPKATRPSIPSGIKKEIKRESGGKCAICGFGEGEYAHIDPVSKSKNNHPHNLIYLCPNCHSRYDKKNKNSYSFSEMREIKNDILRTQVIQWISYSRLYSSVVSLANYLNSIEQSKKTNVSVYQELEKQIIKKIKKAVKEDSNMDSVEEIRFRNADKYDALRSDIKSVIKNDKKVVHNIIKLSNDYIESSGEACCPLCSGTGLHNNWECPICRGVGTVDEEVLDEIDLREYEQAECPLCKGKGEHNNWECPICRGVGTVDEGALDEIDLREYEQAECPLCKGKGEHNNWECPICRGVGTVDEGALYEIDLREYEQAECPLCKGKGEHNNWECPICRGVGTVDGEALDEIDLRDYEQAECPLCKGKREHNNRECPICRGVGTVDKGAIQEIDLSEYE
ncbi:zinc finger domain-containing protein [Paenibacillus silvae]|uniref:zinc finger domain-containing protein n=1 Tax=Paenibacillus silvae TaxID=1325358 RepID=UPI0025A20DB0|nr:zinc finger domain-containing protein [Paenibacillus silvae]MDM5279184.1 zinc finger domain-containing protein [Paenibacillus silvae]